MLPVLVVLGVVLFGAALGRRLLRIAGFRFGSFLEELCFSAGVGLGAVALVVTAVGLAGALRSGPVVSTLAAALALLVPDAARIVISAGRGLRGLRPVAFGRLETVALAAVLLSLGCGLVSSLAPPTSWDATVSHLKVPLRFTERGDVFRLDDLSSNAPLNVAMLFIPAMWLGGDTAPALLHYAFLVFGGLALVAAARRRLSRRGTLVATAAYFLMPVASVIGSEAVADFAVVLYVVLAFIAFLHWWDEGRAGWLLLAGVCVGLAAGSKYTGLIALPPLVLGVCVKARAAGARPGRMLAHGAAAALVAVALASPWYVRNVVETGNPIYPVLADTIPTRHISAAWTAPGGASAGRFSRLIRYPSDLLNLVLFPVNCTLGFARGVREGPAPEGAVQSPGAFLLAFVPLLLFLRPVPGWAKLAVAAAACGFLVVVPVYPLFRYWMPFVAPCSLVAGLAFERLSQGRRGRLLGAVVAAMCVFQLVPFVGRAAARARVVTGLETREAYLLRVDDVYPMARHAADALPPHAKVCYVGERLYHFLRLGVDATMVMPLRQAVVDFALFEEPKELLSRLRALGCTHVVVNKRAVAARARCMVGLLEKLRGCGLTPLERKKGLVLYEVAPPVASPVGPPSARPRR